MHTESSWRVWPYVIGVDSSMSKDTVPICNVNWPDRDDAVGNGMGETGTIAGKSRSDKFWQAASRNLRSQ